MWTSHFTKTHVSFLGEKREERMREKEGEIHEEIYKQTKEKRG